MVFNLYREGTRIGLQVLNESGRVIATYGSPQKDLELIYVGNGTEYVHNGQVGSLADLASRCRHLPITESNLCTGLDTVRDAFEPLRVKRFLELVT
jgi:hypothetical protein